jgi:carboxyl-terminal processing protease
MSPRSRASSLVVLALLHAGIAPLPSARAAHASPQQSSTAEQPPERQPERPYGWFDPIIDVRHLLGAGFVDPPDEATLTAMQEAALAAMVAALGDPYTVYVPPSAEKGFDKALRGTYVGIGAEIDQHEGYLRIVSPLDDSPAREAGVLGGDLVLAIDGTSTFGMHLDRCMDLLLGEPGTPVVLTLRHPDGREEDVTIVRRKIQAQTVKGFRRSTDGWEHLLDPARGIAYLRLTQFTETTAEDLRRSIGAIVADGAKALILDLRFNGGGSLGAAIQTADLFQRGGTIVSVRARDGQGRAWTAQDDPTDLDLPLVVLVNEASASASEILAGSLQENHRAKVLGTRTFGKGSVQDVRALPEGRGSIKITTARYYLPSGRNITRSPKASDHDKLWGVDPDPGYYLALTDDEERTLIFARRPWEIAGGAPTDPSKWADPAWVGRAPGDGGTDGAGDPQLAAAMTALAGKLTTGAWPRVGGDPGTTASLSEELLRVQSYRERLLNELRQTEERIAALERESK